MGGFSDILGTIAVDIVGDYSQLQRDLEGAATMAAQSASTIADAFSGASESYNEFSDAAQSVIDKQTGLNDAVTHAQAVVQELQRGFDEGAVSSQTLARAQAELADAMKAANAQGESEGGIFGELGSKALEFAGELGVVVGVGELLRQTFEAFSTVESATVALDALTGSVEAARGQLEAMEQLATSENLSFPALLEADQRMVAFGFDLGQIPEAMQAVANAAAATNESIDQTANSFERIVASGMISSRTLVQLGLTLGDLASTMGVTQDQVKLLFQAMDQSDRIAILDASLQKFSGDAAAAADTLKGHWQQMKTAFESFFVDAGNLLEGFAKYWLTVFTQLAKIFETFVDAIRTGAQIISLAFTYITQGAAAATQKIREFAAEEAKTMPDLSRSTTTLSPSEVQAGAKLITANTAAAIAPPLVDTDKFKAIQDYTSDIAILTDQLQIVENQQKKTAEAIAQYGLAAQNAGFQISGVALQIAYFQHVQEQANDSMNQALSSVPPLIDDMGNLSDTGERTAKSWQELDAQGKQVNKTLDDMFGKMAPVGTALQQLQSRFDQAVISDDWRRAEQFIGQIAKDDLPAAIKDYDVLIAQARERGAAEGEVLALQQKQLTTEIEDASRRGTDATAQMIALKNSQIQTQLLIDKSQALGQVYVDLTNIFMNAWQQFADGISDAIVNSKNFGDTMMNVLKKIEQEILNVVIGYVMKELRKSLLDNGNLLDGLTKKIAGLLGGGGGAAGASALPLPGYNSGLNLPGITPATPAPSPGATAVSGGLSGIGGIATAVGAIGSFVTGIIGDIQQAHANKVLGEIELNTRSCFNVLAQMQGSLTGIGPYASLASQMKVSGPVAAGAGGGGTAINFNNCTFSGLTQDMVNALFASALRQFKAAGG